MNKEILGFDPPEQIDPDKEEKEEEKIQKKILSETAEEMRYDESKVDEFEQDAILILRRYFMIPDLTNNERLYLREEIRNAMALEQNNADQERAIMDSASAYELMTNRVQGNISVPMEAVFSWFEHYLNIDVMDWDPEVRGRKDYGYTTNPRTKETEIVDHEGRVMSRYMASYRANPKIHKHVLMLLERRRRNDDEMASP